MKLRERLRICALVVQLVAVVRVAGDECGWWRVGEINVPQIEFEDDNPSLLAVPAPSGTVNMDFALQNGLPEPSWARIKELARGLDNDPEKCYRYVRNNIAYASYFGFLKGPERTLLDREGNELDQAFLLLALLRASGFPDAEIRYTPLTFENEAPNVHFRIPLRVQEGGSEYNAADWMGVDASGSISEVAERVQTMHALAGHDSRIVTEGGVSYLATDHFYVRLPTSEGAYAMDPAFKPVEIRSSANFAMDSGYSRTALLNAAGGTVASQYVKSLSKTGLAAYLDARMTTLRNAWTEKNVAAAHYVGENVVKQQPDSDNLYFHGAKVGGSKKFLTQSDVVKNLYRARVTLKIDSADLKSFFLDEMGTRSLWISFENVSANYPKAVLYLDDAVIASESTESSSAVAQLTISISYAMGSYSHRYDLSRGTSNVYAIPIGFGGDSSHGMRKVASDALADRIASGDGASPRTIAHSLLVAGHQWIGQVAMISRLRSRVCGYSTFDYYNVGVVGYAGASFVDFGNRLGYFSNSSDDMNGASFFSSALEHAVLDQLNGISRPSVSTVKVIDAANAAGMRMYFATAANCSTVMSSLTGYANALKTSIQGQVTSGGSALLPQSGNVSVNGWTGYGYAMQDHVNNVAGMFIGGGMNGGYCTVNAPPDALEYFNGTLPVVTADASVNQTISADPVAMPDGAYYDVATDISLPGGTSLNWTRHYDSRQRRRSGDLGFGWCHSFEASVAEVSDPDAFFGGGSVDSALPTVVAQMVIDDMIDGQWGTCTAGQMARRWTLAAMTAQWWTERTTGASVVVTLGARGLHFSRRADGTFAPSPGVTASLVRTANGRYVLSERNGSVYAFNSAGRLTTITDSSGNITTLTYSSDRLVRIANAFGSYFAISWQNGRVSGVTDSAGRHVSYSYDSAGRLSSVVDVRGKTTSYSYDATTSALATKTDPLGNIMVENRYNSLGQVTNQVSDAGGEWNFGYCGGDSAWDEAPDGGRREQAFDAEGRMVRDKERVNGWTRYVHDGHGHVVSSTNKFGRVETYSYGENDLLLSSGVNVADHETGFAHDAQLRVSEVTNAVGGVTRYSYDSHHLVVRTDMPDGSYVMNERTSRGLLSARTEHAPGGDAMRRTEWQYAAASGLPVAKTIFGTGLPAEGVSESYVYDTARRMTSKTDANGNVTSFTYDNAGNVLTKTAPDGTVTSYFYDNAGRMTSSTDALGRTTTFVWTPSGRLASTIGPDGILTTNLYDENDRLVSATDARGTTTTFEYDASGRLLRRIDPTGTSALTYNSGGLLGSATNKMGGVTLTCYDNAYNPVVVSNATGRILCTWYDALDRAVMTSNSIGRVRGFQYDLLGRRTATMRHSGAREASVYDALGNRIAVTNAEGRAFIMVHDALGRMTSATNAAGECVFAAAYDGVGNVVSRTDGAGRTTSFAYDPCDRLVARTTADGTETFSYDLVGNLLSASNGVAEETFAYDLRDRLTNAVTEVGGVAFANAWQRDAGGLVTNVVYADGKSVAREYDAAGRLVAVRDWLGHEWTFSWNGLGLQTGGTSPDGTVHSFSYDEYGNLTAWSVGGIAGRTILRDVEGRRLRDTVTVGPMPSARLRRIAENSFDTADRLVSATAAYDGSRHAVRETFRYDGCGAMTNVTSDGETVFLAAYDAHGRLVSLSAGGTGVPPVESAFSYDALGNRVHIGERIFIPDHSDPLKRPLIECEADGTPLRYYIWGPGRLLGFIDAGRAGGPLPDDVLTVAHSDEQGSVIALTDETGELLHRASYSPHGEDWGSSGDNPTSFAWLGGCGVIRLGGTASVPSTFGQLYLTRHRLYSPVLRRFLSADPLGIDGGLNLYAYANGDPLAYIDPLGLCATGGSLPGFFDAIGNGLATAGQYLARGVDGAWNLALELMASNPHFRETGVQNAVYQIIVDEWGSPLRRLGAYDNAPVVVEPEMVNAVWDLGAAATAYRNLGVNESAIKATTGRATTDFIGNAKVTSFGRTLGEGTIDVRSTIEGIKNGTIKERATFLNIEGLLPVKGSEYYKEFVLPTPTTPKVGPQRIIQGRNGELYYSPDHYHSFIPLN